MTWYDYSIAIASFVADLATKMEAEGWTRHEAGYNTMKPAGYGSIYLLFESLFDAALIYNDGSATTGGFTFIMARIASAYDAGNHRPLESANGGRSRFRMIFSSTDYSASATTYYKVKGWIDSKNVLIEIINDPGVTGGSKYHLIFVGEVEAVGEAANTVMMMVCEYVAEVGTRIDNPTYAPATTESHYIHCLGNSLAYYSHTWGIGASSYDNKVRPMPSYIWRRTAAGSDQNYCIAFQIPKHILRMTSWGGLDTIGDTFVDATVTPNQTFQRMNPPSLGATGGIYWNKADYSWAYTLYGYPWFRRA